MVAFTLIKYYVNLDHVNKALTLISNNKVISTLKILEKDITSTQPIVGLSPIELLLNYVIRYYP